MAWHAEQQWVEPGIGLTPERWAVHAVYVPEVAVDVAAEASPAAHRHGRGRLRQHLPVSEGAGVATIVAELEAAGDEVLRDPFGHVKLDTINPGAWFAKTVRRPLGALKTMVQKRGYFTRSAAADPDDLRADQELHRPGRRLRAAPARPGSSATTRSAAASCAPIEFARVAGHKPFDTTEPWFGELLDTIGQPHA